MNRYVCIHGHFYQPPRENPWLEEIEVQDSANPFRDWNERITAECYNPNTAARILTNNMTVTDIVNNYTKISFNFGPTLLSWMAAEVPDVYQRILEADKESMKIYSGHGSAIAQVYNHMIMPLSNTKDKKTQVIWGIEDFKYRFGRDPEGMWLAETAVDIETLEILAENNIKYTILAPRQAGEIKKIKEQKWHNVSDGTIDPRRAYICFLPSGKSINLFFYDGNISQDLAFGDLMKSGENLAQRMVSTFSEDKEAQLAHIATDGETYGHHQKHGDMALAYCINYIEENKLAEITIYGEFLEKHPPEYEVKIVENTSWSCIHGIERWRNDCGCSSGHPGWNQKWRAPLRYALDWLRDNLAELYAKEMSALVNDPWKLRDDYIKIILDRDPDNIQKIIGAYLLNKLSGENSDDNKVKILKLLEMQRHAMLMYTSCGWFFDEISGIETVQVIQYAARAIQLAQQVSGNNYEIEFKKRLADVPGNIPEVNTGEKVYDSYVKPAVVDLLRVAAHYGISSLFEDFPEHSVIFSYEVFTEKIQKLEAGRSKMVIGRARMRSQITYEENTISYAFIFMGDQNINGGVRETISEEAYDLMEKELTDSFNKLNMVDIILLLDKHFGGHSYSLWSLFKDKSREIFSKIFANTLEDVEHSFRQIYENHYPIMSALKQSNNPLPKAIKTAVDFVINSDLKNVFTESNGTMDISRLQNISNEVSKWNVEIDKNSISYSATKKLNHLMQLFTENINDIGLMKDIYSSIKILRDFGVEPNLWEIQNQLFLVSKESLPDMKSKAEKGDDSAKEWLSEFNNLQDSLNLKIAE